jgi:hypothetical protein
MRMIIALTESSSLSNLAKTLGMVSKADGTDRSVPKDALQEQLGSLGSILS